MDDPLPPPPFHTAQFRPMLIAPQLGELEKKVQLTLIGSRPRAFQRAIDELCTLTLTPPKGGTKRYFAILSSKFQLVEKSLLQSFFVQNPPTAKL